MPKQAVTSKHAPAAIGPYSQAIIADNVVYTAGQVAIDPQTGKLVEGGIEDQTQRVLENLKSTGREIVSIDLKQLERFAGNVLLPTFNLPAGAQDARQVQWGLRYSF